MSVNFNGVSGNMGTCPLGSELKPSSPFTMGPLLNVPGLKAMTYEKSSWAISHPDLCWGLGAEGGGFCIFIYIMQLSDIAEGVSQGRILLWGL